MQGARHGFINGKQDVKAAEKHSVECIVLLTLWFIILSCLGRCSKRPSHNILFNRSIVHAISLLVSEVLFSSVVSAHTIVCVCVCIVYTLCMCAAPECQQCSSRMYWKELSFAPKCFLIAYIFKQTRLKIACKWYNLVTTCSGQIWQVTNPSVLHAIGESLLSSPGTPLENNRTT